MLNPWQKALRKIYHQQVKKVFSSDYLRPHKLSKKLRRRLYGLLYLTLIIALFFWNWTLFLATGAGIGMMVFVYGIQDWNWESYQEGFNKWFQGANSRLTISVGMGGFSAFLIYLITTIWVTSENRWLATGEILQGLLTLMIAGLLLWQVTANQKLKNTEKFEYLLDDLTNKNQLKRLITIRKLTNLFLLNQLNKTQESQLKDYFQIMLSHEQEIILQEALLESIEKLNFTEKQPLQIPLNLSQSQSKISLKQAQPHIN
jgi:hypothetical protein